MQGITLSRPVQRLLSDTFESTRFSSNVYEAALNEELKDVAISNKPKDFMTSSIGTVSPSKMASAMRSEINDLIQKTYYERCCSDGIQKDPMHFGAFRQMMYDTYPDVQKKLKPALKKFEKGLCITLCETFPRDEQGKFLDEKAVLVHLQHMRPDKKRAIAVKTINDLNTKGMTAAKAVKMAAKPPVGLNLPQPKSKAPQAAVLDKPVLPQHTTLPEPLQVNNGLARPHSTARTSNETKAVEDTPAADDILAKKLKQLETTFGTRNAENYGENHVATQRQTPDFQLFGKLLVDRNKDMTTSVPSTAIDRSIRQAPLLAAEVVAQHYEDLLPQYGLLGSLKDEKYGVTNPQLFLNTNVPFSAFICGVQGSGKSHTTSCILENAILASPHLGRLESPVSTLVFSYGEWSSGGAGFNISEATFLGTSHPDFPNHQVKKVTVLYSPSNVAIKALYERLPNVEMVPFRLKAQTLDISALHTLMAVDEKSTMPLYMATVEAILRGIASESADGSLNYLEFKRRLAKEKFDSVQTNMLKMRMNLLESFLDLNGTASKPEFRPGEVTIIDLSDPFLTPSTACILFKLGLEQFLQSRAPGKMVVLDEAHKYMFDTPGSKILTDYLTRVIRLQRHQGARIVISTQEPTVATELIALCSVTFMHRFTSPTWYAALKKRINAIDDEKAIMQQIESLETGEALVYSPSAVLGKNDDGSLVKAIGRLMKVNIRNRVTLDGGASIMAV